MGANVCPHPAMISSFCTIAAAEPSTAKTAVKNVLTAIENCTAQEKNQTLEKSNKSNIKHQTSNISSRMKSCQKQLSAIVSKNQLSWGTIAILCVLSHVHWSAAAPAYDHAGFAASLGLPALGWTRPFPMRPRFSAQAVSHNQSTSRPSCRISQLKRSEGVVEWLRK